MSHLLTCDTVSYLALSRVAAMRLSGQSAVRPKAEFITIPCCWALGSWAGIKKSKINREGGGGEPKGGDRSLIDYTSQWSITACKQSAAPNWLFIYILLTGAHTHAHTHTCTHTEGWDGFEKVIQGSRKTLYKELRSKSMLLDNKLHFSPSYVVNISFPIICFFMFIKLTFFSVHISISATS